jgi:transketolase
MNEDKLLKQQQENDARLLKESKYLGNEIESKVIPFHLNPKDQEKLTSEQKLTIQALEIKAARTAIKSLASLAKINELDHLGGGLDLISAFILTLAVTDYENVEYTIENAHTSIGYYSSLSAFGFLEEIDVIEKFRRSLDIAGHVSWVPGGTQLNGGRLGVMIPVAVGQALGKKAVFGEDAWVITHCGDAGWISGQALNGFNGADLHHAPITFIMHRNGIQLSGSNRQIMDKDPRPIIESLGIKILEISSLHDLNALYPAYQEAAILAHSGIPSMIYPVGYATSDNEIINLNKLCEMYGIAPEAQDFSQKNNVSLDTKIWIPGSLMSYRDIEPMLECVFLVNDLEGGKGHHDGHMKGRDEEQVLGNSMLSYNTDQKTALKNITETTKRSVITKARPAPGSANLQIKDSIVKEVKLPEPGKNVSPRAGVDKGYAAVAESNPDKMFVISCDLDASTKLGTARKYLSADRSFEMSIEEQVSALMANGLAMSSYRPQLNVFSTFAAFFEGIAREGFEMWRYQRNLTGVNEGLNVTFHLSHVGSCTGRDHFSGWSLDWINLAIGYLPYLHRFYTPADARAAFVAVKDLAEHYGGHIIGIPRDNLPVLTRQDEKTPLWVAGSVWEPVTLYRTSENASKAILALGAPAFLAGEAFNLLKEKGKNIDVYVINGLPIKSEQYFNLLTKYTDGIVTVEDGIIGTKETGLRGFAGLLAGLAYGSDVPLEHIGIRDPRIAPSEGHMEVWAHFGITVESLVDAVQNI